jgi:hypothetical protein
MLLMPVFVSLFAVTATLLVFRYLVWRYAIVAWASIVAMPTLLSAYWAQTFTLYWVQAPDADLFFWIKLYTVLLGATWVIAVRFSRLGRDHWALITVFLFGELNILEAVIKDLLGGSLPHYLNAVAGLTVAATAAYGYDRFTVDANKPHLDLEWDPFQGSMSWAWVMCYTTWNWVFVYLNYPELVGLDTAALVAPLLGAIGDRAQYAQGRVYGLAGALLLLFTFPSFFSEHMNTVAWSTPIGRELGAALTLLLTSSFVACLAWGHLSAGRGEVMRQRFAGSTLQYESSQAADSSLAGDSRC